MSAHQREPLTRERVLSEAVALADEVGLAELSMRKLAARLGFEVMSLYNHVKNKDDLYRGMVDFVAAEIPIENTDEDWRTSIRQHAIATKNTLVRHRWAVMLWVTTLPGPNRFDHMEWELRTLSKAGLDDVAAHHAFHAISTHVVGYTLQAELMDFNDIDAIAADLFETLDSARYGLVRAHIGQHLDGDHGPSFEFVLDLLLDGIAALDAGANPI